MQRSKLFIRAFTAILIGVTLCVLAFLGITVWELNRQSAIWQERSVHILLNTADRLVDHANRDIERWYAEAIKARRHEAIRWLDWIERENRRLQAGTGTVDQAGASREILALVTRLAVRCHLFQLQDTEGTLLAHSQAVDGGQPAACDIPTGSAVVANVQSIGLSGLGWKLSVVTDVSDLDRGMAVSQHDLIAGLRDDLLQLPLLEHGRLFVIDGKGRILIHSDRTLEGKTEPLANSFIAATRTSGGSIPYRWPEGKKADHDRQNEAAWARHYPPLDWYLIASIDQRDLNDAILSLQLRLVIAAILILLLALLGGYWLVREVTTPMSDFAHLAERVAKGDLNVEFPQQREDEVGALGRALNVMVRGLGDEVVLLEQRVQLRTEELQSSLRRLEARNRAAQKLTLASDRFQQSETEQELIDALAVMLQDIFPESGGRLLLLTAGDQLLRERLRWGRGMENPGCEVPLERCRALQAGRLLHRTEVIDGVGCAEAQTSVPPYICAPVFARGDMLGVIHVSAVAMGQESASGLGSEEARDVIGSLAELFGLAKASLSLRERLQQETLRDPLTGLFNRRFLEETLHLEERKRDDQLRPLGILMIDVDHFKWANDRWGHDAGDKVLQALARLTEAQVRDADLVCRYGGEEFTVLLPSASLAQCLERAEAIRSRTERELAVRWGEEEIRVTVSVGVAALPESAGSVLEVLHLADQALLQAKREGRNRVAAAPPASGSSAQASGLQRG